LRPSGPFHGAKCLDTWSRRKTLTVNLATGESRCAPFSNHGYQERQI
jgi:hypothetical protein